MWPIFSFLLMVKCERNDQWRHDKQKGTIIMMWKILSLFRQQKMRQCVLGESTRVLIGLHFVDKIRYMTLGWNQLILAKVCNRNRVIQEGSVENLMLYGVISLRCMGDKWEEFYTNRNGVSLDWKGQRWEEMKEEWLWGQSYRCKAREDNSGSRR